MVTDLTSSGPQRAAQNRQRDDADRREKGNAMGRSSPTKKIERKTPLATRDEFERAVPRRKSWLTSRGDDGDPPTPTSLLAATQPSLIPEATREERPVGDESESEDAQLAYWTGLKAEVTRIADEQIAMDEQLAAQDLEFAIEITQACDATVRQIERELEVANSATADGQTTGYDLAEIERRLRIARLRFRLAANREARAARLQRDLQRQHNLVSRLIAITKTANAADVAVTQLEATVAEEEAALSAAKQCGKPAKAITRLEQDVEVQYLHH